MYMYIDNHNIVKVGIIMTKDGSKFMYLKQDNLDRWAIVRVLSSKISLQQ